MKTHDLVPRSLISILAMLLLSALHGRAEPAGAAAPSIHFESPAHDFGRVLSGSSLRHEYLFTNRGKANLIIANVAPSCGCSTTDNWPRRVPPGGQGRIPIQFNSAGMLGEVQKSVAIHSNDPDQPVTVLTFRGTIWKPVELHPAVALIQMPPRTTEALSTTVRIVNQTDQPLKIEPPVCNVPQIQARLIEADPGKEFHLVVDTVPPLPHRDHQAIINLATSSADAPQLTIPVIVIAQPEIMVTPTQMFLPAAPPDHPEPYVIHVRNQSTGPIALDGASCDAPGSKVEIRETTPGHEFEVAVSFPPDFGYMPDRSFAIRVHTSLASQPVLTIPVNFATPATQPGVRRR